MNKKQKIIKKLAKRAKARQNKVEVTSVGVSGKERYISKAERARLAAQADAAEVNAAEANAPETEAAESPGTEAVPATATGDNQA
ncbi:DUF2986 domain-containing protein [Shewanella salipaludis]|uniref:DUF2986 domain-containing protein n=1 Tax=Shewanella salipaludis TaxID=2723052 RepID=A0A972FQK2_9GAMM|nr:DUF2986 domain-containing protein [Shewanella salipaludis]NMH64323.1 DUF2986 domain-containing protein [Shewanella salipaludis]